jgi:hypothetical protein
MNSAGRTTVTTLVLAAFLWALTLSVSPGLHQISHPAAAQTEHTCAATLMASGSCQGVAPVGCLTLSSNSVCFSKVPALFPEWVSSPFLSALVFEHAPPATS